MSPKIKARLSRAGCSKRYCIATTCGHPARHHVRHQAMWLRVWAARRSYEPRWKRFVARYHTYHPEDVVVLGANHHAEAHILYDVIIGEHRRATGLPLSRYSWRQAEHLMDCLEVACKHWLEASTPGFSYRTLNRLSEYRAKREDMQRLASQGRFHKTLLNAIKRYEKHRAWLQETFEAFCTVQTVPPTEED